MSFVDLGTAGRGAGVCVVKTEDFVLPLLSLGDKEEIAKIIRVPVSGRWEMADGPINTIGAVGNRAE